MIQFRLRMMVQMQRLFSKFRISPVLRVSATNNQIWLWLLNIYSHIWMVLNRSYRTVIRIFITNSAMIIEYTLTNLDSRGQGSGYVPYDWFRIISNKVKKIIEYILTYHDDPNRTVPSNCDTASPWQTQSWWWWWLLNSIYSHSWTRRITMTVLQISAIKSR